MAPPKGKRRQTHKSDRYEDEGEMRKSLREIMYNTSGQQQHLRFICTQRLLYEFWNKHRVEKIAAFQNYDKEVFNKIRNGFLRVLSIVIFIEWNDLFRFEPVFVKEGLDDNSLFFDEGQLEDMESGIDNFIAQQYLFKPEIIKHTQYSYIQHIDAVRRLPFIGEPELLGKGGYGCVSKKQIAPHCLEIISEENVTNRNSDIVAVAVKEYPTSKSGQDFRREVNNLNFLKESLREQKCVMKHKAAIIHGNTFMIIMPLANHYNLEVFFWDGRPPLEEDSAGYATKYVFSDRFPRIGTEADLHKAVVKQVYQLADALHWFHHDLRDFEKQNSYLAHMDLKPENILIHGNPEDKNTPVGQWMVTDFGISAFYKDSHKPTQDMPTIRTVTSRLTQLSVRGRGPYQPPEIGLETKKEELGLGPRSRHNLDYRQCDVWSFGCVLCDALAFALNRREGIRAIREVRAQEGNDNLYKFVKSVEAIEYISASNTELKGGFVNWRKKIEERHELWVPGYLNILFQDSIVPRPADRKCIGKIRDSLGELYPKLSSAANSKNSIDLGGLGITQTETQQDSPPGPSISIQVPQGKHIKDSPNQPVQQNNLTDGIPSARKHRNPENDVTRGLSSGSGPSPNVAADHQQLQERSLGNGFAGGSPSVPVHSSSAAADLQQLQIENGDLRHSSFPVPLDREADVKAVALDSTGEWIAIIAVLNEAKFHVFPTRQPESSGQKSSNISAEVTWENVRIAHPWLAIFGVNSSKNIEAELYDLQTRNKQRNLGGEDAGDILSDIRLTDTGMAACAYAEHARLYFPQSDDPHPLRIHAPGATISRMAFNADGRRLFFWLEGHSMDYVCMYEIDPSEKTARSRPSLSFHKERSLRDPRGPSNIWPATNLAFCVIHQRDGAFMAQIMPSRTPSGGQRTSEIQSRRVVDARDVVAGLIHNNNLLLCLQDSSFFHPHKRLFTYKVNFTGNTWELAKGHRVDSKLSSKIDPSAGMCIQESSDLVELVFYSTDKKILRYTLSRRWS